MKVFVSLDIKNKAIHIIKALRQDLFHLLTMPFGSTAAPNKLKELLSVVQMNKIVNLKLISLINLEMSNCSVF